jgi:hypothetical protein
MQRRNVSLGGSPPFVIPCAPREYLMNESAPSFRPFRLTAPQLFRLGSLDRRGSLGRLASLGRVRSVGHLGSLVLALTFALGCSKTSGGGKSAEGGKCFAAPAGSPGAEAPLEPVEYPSSQVWVEADLPQAAVSEGLARAIPFTLAAETKRDVGAPGYATYRVTRGTPTLHETKNGLEVQVPIDADISICKKIGPSCIQYGSCQPAFLASFTLSPEVGNQFQLAPPEGTISATKRCVIGLDVTSQIEEIARAEVAKVEAEIKHKWPRLKPEVENAFQEMEKPLPLAEGQCVHLHPNKVFYQTAHLTGEAQNQRLETAVGLSGTIEPAPDCKKSRKSRPLPKISTKEKPGKRSRLWIPEVLSLDFVREELTRSLTGAAGEEGTLKVLAVRLEKTRVLLHIEASGSVCGSFWLEGNLAHEAGGEALTLKDLKLSGAATPLEMKDLLSQIEAKGQVPVGSAGWFTTEATEPLKAGLRAAVPAQVKFDIKSLKAGNARVLTTSEGVYVLHPLTARLVVTGF